MLHELRRPGYLPQLRKEDPNDREYVHDNPLATWWIQKTPGTTYWRAQVPAKALPGQALAFKFSDLISVGEEQVALPRQKGAAIWQFVGNGARGLVMAELQDQGVKVLMEVDDNYLSPPPPVKGASGGWTRKLDRKDDQYSFQAHRKICQFVDGIICSTAPLADMYSKATSAPVYHCPNSVDLDDWPPGTPREGKRAIGFAGSASHVYDISIIRRALDHAWRQDGVEVWKMGITADTWSFPHRDVPWTDDLAQYRRNLQVLDVGLCPLKRSPWHDAKSDIKAMEYTLAGAVPIVQADSPAFSDWIGIVPSASTEKEWLKAVKWACSAPQDELDEVWERAYNFLFDHKRIHQHIHKWREAIR